MCFSTEVNKEVQLLMKRFRAEYSIQDDSYYKTLQASSKDYDFVKAALNLKRKPTSEFFKEPGADNRIFPGYFTWIMVQENGQNIFKKMRYRVRPQGSKEEIPSKFNVFNARLDSLETRQTWQRIFTKQHGIFPFTRFYEWVEFEGQKRLISFAPKNREIMWAPCLWEYWENPAKTFGFYSFALITDEPPIEVSEMGHDRCPIFLKEGLIQDWLDIKNKSMKDFYEVLKYKEDVLYLNQWAA